MNENIRKSVQCQDDERIVYVAGYHVVLYDLKDKNQSYYHGAPEYRGFSCIAMSPLRRFLAVGAKGPKSDKEGGPEKPPAILIYDSVTQKKKKTLIFLDANIKIWDSLAFGTQ